MLRIRRCILVATIFLVSTAASAFAFHDGGVAYCAGCHTMHVSQDGQPGPGWTPGGNPNLLKYGTATDTCLRCHATRGQFAGGQGYGPGGDFYWLTRTFTWTTPWGATESSSGASHGHNVVSQAYGVDADPVLATAPGGTFLGSRLGCTSCHDPHGNGNFRMLYGTDLGPSYGGGTRFGFTGDAPLARGTAGSAVIGGDGVETSARHTVYKSGISAWCANCHPALHADGGERFQHPTGAVLSSAIANIYNRYVSTDEPTGGTRATSYLGLVPFEAVNVDLDTVDPTNATTGPASSDRVMCLTCHRAHASPFADAGRWDFAATLLAADSHPRAGDLGATDQDIANRYYGVTFTAHQRSLCNKCHAKDYDDVPDSRVYPSRRGAWPHVSEGS